MIWDDNSLMNQSKLRNVYSLSSEKKLGQLRKREYAQNIDRFTVWVNNIFIIKIRYPKPIKSMVYANNCLSTDQ